MRFVSNVLLLLGEVGDGATRLLDEVPLLRVEVLRAKCRDWFDVPVDRTMDCMWTFPV